MPDYNLRIGNSRFTLASTDAPLSKSLGKRLATVEPETKVDSSGASTSYSFDGQDISFEDLRDIRDMREAGGQIAQLMTSKALLNFGEGAEFHVENDEETETVVDGEPMTLTQWLEANFPHLDLLVLDLGEDALWYPYAVGETLENRAGEFKKLLPAEPWTLMPVTNEQGQVVGWHQRVKQSGGYQEQTLGKDDLWHIVLNKSSARDETGISEVLRSKDEIQAFKENEQAINQAIELHGFPQRHVKVGKEDGAPVRDGDFRQVRTVFDPHTSDANTAYFTGQDVNVDTLEAHQFDYQAIHEMDMRNLTTALGLPLEAGNVGSDGLGSGKPAELRFALLKLAIKANQRKFSHQFVDKVLRPVIREYSPFDADAQVRIEIDDPLEDIGEVADLLNKVGGYMTNAEARRMLDLSEPEDDEIAESYRKPSDREAAEEGDAQGGPFGGDGGFFSERGMRQLQRVPDNAVSISDRSEAPEGANVIEGPGGGLYYVPGGGGGEEGTPSGGAPPEEVSETVSELVADGSHDEVESYVGDSMGVDDVSLPAGMSDEETTRMASTLAYAGENGMAEQVDTVEVRSGDEFGVYTFNDNTLAFNMDLDESELEGARDDGEAVGEDLEWLALHELGHANHNGNIDDLSEAEAMFDTGMAVTRDGEFVGRERVDLVDDEVSSYARSNPAEFVAEVFSGLAMGQEFSDDVMDIYEEYDGPDTWQNYRGEQ